jgi:hypothetical protein
MGYACTLQNHEVCRNELGHEQKLFEVRSEAVTGVGSDIIMLFADVGNFPFPLFFHHRSRHMAKVYYIEEWR